MELKVCKKGICLQAKTHQVGDDLLIVVKGGDKPHIGSCVLTNKDELKTTNFASHKDHIALEIIAKKLHKKNKNIALVGGIHIDNITKKQIKTVLKLSKKLAKKLAKDFV